MMQYRHLLTMGIVLIAASPALLGAQAGRVFCITPSDSTWRPAFFGYNLSVRGQSDRAGGVRYFYPVIRDVVAGSPADSAGVRDGDELRAINGIDLVLRHDSVRVIGPGVPTRMIFGRADSTFERTLVGLAVHRSCPDSLKRRGGS
jgi:hypothetical protein